MATIGGQDYTGLRAINLRGSTKLRLEGDGGFAGTLSVRAAQDSSRAWTFPDKSGTFPIMGTFAVQLKGPGAAENSFSTIVTVSGIRAEDALLVQLNRGSPSSGYDLIGANSGATAFILTSAKPGNGNVTLMFYNALGATSYVDLQCSYLAMR